MNPENRNDFLSFVLHRNQCEWKYFFSQAGLCCVPAGKYYLYYLAEVKQRHVKGIRKLGGTKNGHLAPGDVSHDIQETNHGRTYPSFLHKMFLEEIYKIAYTWALDDLALYKNISSLFPENNNAGLFRLMKHFAEDFLYEVKAGYILIRRAMSGGAGNMIQETIYPKKVA